MVLTPYCRGVRLIGSIWSFDLVQPDPLVACPVLAVVDLHLVASAVVAVTAPSVSGLSAATPRAHRYWHRCVAPRRNLRRGSDLSANFGHQQREALSPSLVK